MDFNEFKGQPGGWENRETNFNYEEYSNQNATNPVTRGYQVVKQGTAVDGASGEPAWVVGQGSETLSVTTQVQKKSTSTWARLRGGISNQGISSQVEVGTNTSHPGDWGLVSYRFDLPAGMRTTGKDLRLRLDNVNGSGELYEWAFVTVNDLNPFEDGGVAALDGYGIDDYTNFANSNYFNPDGTVKAGGVADPNLRLPKNKTISQFLAGDEGTSTPGVAGGRNVRPGWYAADLANVRIKDGPEDFDNPGVGTGYPANVFDVNQAGLGVDDLEEITSFTVWMGYFDVAPDTDGDGRTKTGNGSQIGQLTSLNLGFSVVGVPEPSASVLTLSALLGFFLRRRR